LEYSFKKLKAKIVNHLKDGHDTLTSEQASYFFKHSQSTGSHE